MSRSLGLFLAVVALLSFAIIAGARAMGERGAYLAQLYMLGPAIAAVIVRATVHPTRFRDAAFRLGRIRDWGMFYLASLALTVLSFAIGTAFGAITWDPSGRTFLDALDQQFKAAGQDMRDLPAGLTPQHVLWLYVLGGLTVFNVVPGLITGLGEELGWRGLMFPELYRRSPAAAYVLGGLIWFAWHVPLVLVVPQSQSLRPWELALSAGLLAVGSICTHAYLALALASSRSIFVAAFAHIAINNTTRSFAYFATIENQLLANVALVIASGIVAGAMYRTGRRAAIGQVFGAARELSLTSTPASATRPGGSAAGDH